MKEEKLGQEPVFPCEVGIENGMIVQGHQNGNYTYLDNGMSKRFYAACAAMQGLLANPQFITGWGYSPKEIIESSYELADELLRQEGL